MEHLISLIVGIAWPVAAVWIAYLFRGELKALLSRVSHLKYKELEAKFEKGLVEAEADARLVAQVLPPALPPPETMSKLDQLRRIAEVSPRAAIMESWVLIETAASQAGLISGTVIPRTNPKMIVEYLARSGKLPESSIPLIEKLRHLRNQAAHLPEFVLTQEEAERYLELAVKSSEVISSAHEQS